MSLAQDFQKEVQESIKTMEQIEEEFQQRMRETLRGVESLRITIAYNGDLLVDDRDRIISKKLENLVTRKLKKVGIKVKFLDDNIFHINLETCRRVTVSPSIQYSSISSSQFSLRASRQLNKMHQHGGNINGVKLSKIFPWFLKTRLMI